MTKPRPLPERFWPKVQRTEACWLWTGGRDRDGYGGIRLENGHMGRAHRVAYELLVGPIPNGLQLDHLCRVRSCVNPAHLEPVTGQVNFLRGTSDPARNARMTHCHRGHALPDRANRANGRRGCNACQRQRRAEQRAARAS